MIFSRSDAYLLGIAEFNRKDLFLSLDCIGTKKSETFERIHTRPSNAFYLSLIHKPPELKSIEI